MTSEWVSRGNLRLILSAGAFTAVILILTWASITTDSISSSNISPTVIQKCECGRTTEGISNENVHHTTIEEVPKIVEIATHAPEEQCEKRLPGAIIVGIQKSGTTTLLRFLNDHPQIAACKSVGEPKYFSDNYDKPLAWYRDLMPCSYSNQITMEKSPPYFYREYSPRRIRNMDPKIKLIITVKEPVERAISMYAMLADANGVQGKSFEDYIMSNNRTKILKKSRMVQFSNYQKHMKYWLDNFDMKQILIIDGHNLITDPSSELMKVEKFLQIGSYFTTERFVFNATKGMYCILKSGVPSCMGSKKGRPHPIISTDVRMKLQKYFKPLNEMFFKMIGRRLEWGY